MKFQKIIALSALSLICVPTFATSKIPVPQHSKITEIVLENGVGFVAPPYKLYKLVLRADGKAYRVSGLSDAPQKTTANLSPEVFNRLSQLLTARKFFEMKDRYTPDPMRTDGPSVYINAVRGGQRKTVDNYMDGAPVEVWGIEQAIRGVASQLDWKPVPQAVPYSRNKGSAKNGFIYQR